ncbi:MAG: hypothetical protein HZB44_04685 [Actinobacteria bacterium]|nr:hypothetical protein [Actinomycetota bacterium]
MKSRSLVRQYQKINWLIENTEVASKEQLELQAHWGRYLCVLVAGFMENAIGEIYSDFSRQAASDAVAKYVSHKVLRIQNPNAQRFVETASAFRVEWGKDLELFLEGNGRKAAIDAIMANRHQIAHGSDAGITVARVKDYLLKCVEVVEYLETQCNLA